VAVLDKFKLYTDSPDGTNIAWIGLRAEVLNAVIEVLYPSERARKL
jgi:hypothetical protein